jgi:ring-1,2-phenylacetyl-CoA epoxidase subunit PaaC
VLSQLAVAKHAKLAAIAAKAAKEARYHVRHARDWWLRLGGGTEESHGRLQSAVDALWPFTVELVTPDALDTSLCAAGLGADLEAIRLQFECELAALLEAAGLARPPDPQYPPLGGRHGAHGEHLDHLLSEMQSVARAHPGAHW